ncbi:MAG: hypothetical protein ISR91_07610 [Candidatus Delongbacteria bacterium]|nr:hypothetical protein [Candidatus Delongbacteria bacterium]
MSTKEIFDTIWKYLILVVAVWALILMTGHLCMSRGGGHGFMGCDSRGFDHCEGFEGFCNMSGDDVQTDIEWIVEDGDSMMVVTINTEGLHGDALHTACTKMMIATDDDDDSPRKRVIRKVVKSRGE